jgi:hypothetical protein
MNATLVRMPDRPNASALDAVADLLMLAEQYGEYGVSIVITPDTEGWCVGYLEDDDRRPGKRRGGDLSAAYDLEAAAKAAMRPLKDLLRE